MYFVRTNLDVDVIVTKLQVPSSSEEAGLGPKRKRTIADANALFGFTIEREIERERAVSLVKLAPVFFFCFLIISTCRGALGIDSIDFYLLRRPTFIHPQHSIDSSQDSTHPPYSKYYYYYLFKIGRLN